jgi:hypothetical protein
MHRRIHELWPTFVATAGLFLVFVGERVFTGDDSTRFALAGLGGAALVAAIGWRAKEWSIADADRRRVSTLILACTAGLGAAVLMYALIPGVFHGDSSASERIRGVLWAMWPIVLVSSLVPLVAIEFATASVAYIDRYEHARVRRSLERGLALALLLSSLFLANYIANRHDEKWDLSAGNQATASDVTQRAIRDLTKPVEVYLFFPRASDVAETVARYFEPLTRSNSNLTIKTIDHALASELSKKAKVTENGYVAILHGEASEKIRVGEKMQTARSNLRRFDQNFLKALITVTTSKKVAYFTHGHDERADKAPHEDDKRAAVNVLRRQLESWQFTVKNFGIAEGSTSEVPKDASILFVMGPEKPLLEAEIDTLKRYVDRGGRLFVALEGEREGDPMAGLLSAYGLTFDKTILANVVSNAPLTKTDEDKVLIWTNKYSSHASVTTMTRNEKLATVFNRSGSLAALDGKIENIKTDMVITAVPDTFADTDGDMAFDEGERKDKLGLAAAVTRTSTTGKKELEGRVFILSDVDVVADDFIKLIKGNVLLMADIVYWLQLTQDPIIPTIEEKDVKIVHRKDQDALLFYGTTFGVPILVMGAGMFQIRRRRRS